MTSLPFFPSTVDNPHEVANIGEERREEERKKGWMVDSARSNFAELIVRPSRILLAREGGKRESRVDKQERRAGRKERAGKGRNGASKSE